MVSSKEDRPGAVGLRGQEGRDRQILRAFKSWEHIQFKFKGQTQCDAESSKSNNYPLVAVVMQMCEYESHKGCLLTTYPVKMVRSIKSSFDAAKVALSRAFILSDLHHVLFSSSTRTKGGDDGKKYIEERRMHHRVKCRRDRGNKSAMKRTKSSTPEGPTRVQVVKKRVKIVSSSMVCVAANRRTVSGRSRRHCYRLALTAPVFSSPRIPFFLASPAFYASPPADSSKSVDHL
uniref:Reverse transcriptase Ty1/copia-type domain-containing protein n=1 Tax=Steinernema glaseri TaxID=37863 RepID=A0A1I7XZQ2_9BILA